LHVIIILIVILIVIVIVIVIIIVIIIIIISTSVVELVRVYARHSQSTSDSELVRASAG